MPALMSSAIRLSRLARSLRFSRTVNGELDTDHFRDAVKGGDVKAAFLTLTANQATGESASAENKRQVIAKRGSGNGACPETQSG